MKIHRDTTELFKILQETCFLSKFLAKILVLKNLGCLMSIVKKIIAAGLHEHAFRDSDLANLLNISALQRHAAVNRAMSKGELIRLRRGLYLLSPEFLQQPFSQFYLANHIVPHSVVSAESALSYYGWIPERVTMVTSVIAIGRHKHFATPCGEFVYHKIPVELRHFLLGVDLVKIDSRSAWIASPLRALLDYIYWHKEPNPDFDFVTESLRVEPENLLSLQSADFSKLQKLYSIKKMLIFLNKIQKSLIEYKVKNR